MNKECGLRIGTDPTFPITTNPKQHTGLPGADAMQEHRRRGSEAVPASATDSQPLVSMRSSKGMEGLLLAEVGASMVELDLVAGLSGSSGFKDGARIEPGFLTPLVSQAPKTLNEVAHVTTVCKSSASRSLGAIEVDPILDQRRNRTSSKDHCQEQEFARSGTLLNMYASPARKASELKLLLGDSSSKVKHGAIASSATSSGKIKANTKKNNPNAVAFEQGKSRARVSLDLELENKICVEGGYVSGTVRVRVRSPSKSKERVVLGGGKIRIAGFEVVPGRSLRNIFYQISAPLVDISPENCAGLFATPADDEGFAYVEEGKYSVPFSMLLPIVSSSGKPKGVLHNCSSGVMIRYIAIASIKVVDPDTGKRSIAHFYRDCEVWPRLNPASTLCSAPQPIRTSSSTKKSTSFLVSDSGEEVLRLTVELARSTWVAGQRCHVRILIENENLSEKKKGKSVKSIGLALLRTVRIFRPSPKLDAVGGRGSEILNGADDVFLSVDPDSCETETIEKKVAEETLLAGQKSTQGYASSRGWWMGVSPGETGVVVHSITIPSDALSVVRARLLEVEYSLKVSLGVGSITGNTDAVSVVLPIRVVNFVSLDPPPSVPIFDFGSSSALITPKASQSASALCLPGKQLSSAAFSTSKASYQSDSKARAARTKPKIAPNTDSMQISIDPPGPSVSLQSIHSGPNGTRLAKCEDEHDKVKRLVTTKAKVKSKEAVPRQAPATLPRSAHMRIRVTSKGTKDLKASKGKTARRSITAEQTVFGDLGGLEDVDALQDVFGGDIPGSVSLLEEQYMNFEGVTGYDDSGLAHGTGDGWVVSSRARGPVKSSKTAKKTKRKEDVICASASGLQPLPRPPRDQEFAAEENDSDDELERFVEGWKPSPEKALAKLGPSESLMTDATCEDDEGCVTEDSNAQSKLCIDLLYERRRAKNLSIFTSGLPNQREEYPAIVKAPGSPHKHTFSERVQMKKGVAQQTSAAQTQDSATQSATASQRSVKRERAQEPPVNCSKQLISESKSTTSGVRARVAIFEEQTRSAAHS